MKLLASNIVCGKQIEVEFIRQYDETRAEVKWNNHNFIVNTYDLHEAKGN